MSNRILDIMPRVLPRESDSVIKRYTDAHVDEFSNVETLNEEAVTRKQIDNATGDDLDRIGAIFGALGRRRGRTDSEYRQFLKSIATSFGGRGSVQGLKFAVASGITGADASDIVINEDFENNSYDVEITGGGTYYGPTVQDLAELADPSCVELGTISIAAGGEEIIIGVSASTVTSDSGLGGDSLDGTSTLN